MSSRPEGLMGVDEMVGRETRWIAGGSEASDQKKNHLHLLRDSDLT